MRFADFFDFSDRRVLVTGAAHGLGAAIAAAFARQGAHVVLADCDAPAVADVAARLGPAARWHPYDQADRTAIEHLAAAAEPVDVLINNAGVVWRGPLLETDFTVTRQLIDVDLLGVIELTRLLGRGMVARGHGVVINIGSQLALSGAHGRAVYAAAKAAVSQFTRTAAVEWGPHGVRVNCIAPGRMLTRMTHELLADRAEYVRGLAHIPLGRYGVPDDIAHAALFLASEAAAYITGQTIVVDGGWTLA